jgi:hypothetical protein
LRGVAKTTSAIAGSSAFALAKVNEVLQTGIEWSEKALDKGMELDLAIAQSLHEEVVGWEKLNSLLREQEAAKVACYTQLQACQQASGRYLAAITKGERLLAQRTAFRRHTAEKVSNARYKDMAFRVFRNDALQKYRAQFDLAARYSYLALKAYGYETNLLDFDARSGERLLERVTRERSLGNIVDGQPRTGPGLAGVLGELNGNFQSLRGMLGFNNPTVSTDKFSLRREHFRTSTEPEVGDPVWAEGLRRDTVWDLRSQIPEFNEFCTSFQPYNEFDPANPRTTGEPAIVIEFRTTINANENFFGRPGSTDGGESFYPSDHFAIRVRGVGIWFTGYSDAAAGGLVSTPRCYLIPVGSDCMRVPFAEAVESERRVRVWNIMDQLLPLPYPLGEASFSPRQNGWIPADQLPGTLLEPRTRRYASIRAHHDSIDGLGGIDEADFETTTTLVGRSVWNTRWMVIIPGRFLLQGDPHEGIRRFIEGAHGTGGISDIRLAFQTYQYASGAGKPEESADAGVE